VAGGIWVYRWAPGRGLFVSKAAPPTPRTVPPPPVLPTSPAPLPSPPAAPVITRFNANLERLLSGNSASLEWDVTGADEVRIDPELGRVDASGEKTVHPAEPTTYTLTARGPGGEKTARVSISVAPAEKTAANPNPAKALYEAALNERKAGHNAKALDLFRQSAEAGDVRAMLEVAEEGLDSDNSDSEHWFRKAAELGDASAMLNLGAMYQLGNHVKEDYGQAVIWYRQAAEKGNSSAMYNLGRMYERGNGVPKDLAKAKELYQKASAKGNSDARVRLDQLMDQ